MISNSSDRNLYFDPVSGYMRFDVDFDIPSNIPEAISWPMDAQRENKRYGFKNLTLALTMRCNMACEYCWQYRSDIPDMDKATISKWLDFFLDPVNNQPNKILYYGGEPLLRMDLIQFAASQMRKLCAERGMAPVKQHIFTNGTLLTDANLDILQTENVFLILSVDGAPQLNRLYRHLAGGEAVDDLIAAGIQRMHARNMKFGVCCTLSKADFDAEQSIAYILREIRPNSIELNLRHDAAFCKEAERYSGQLRSGAGQSGNTRSCSPFFSVYFKSTDVLHFFYTVAMASEPQVVFCVDEPVYAAGCSLPMGKHRTKAYVWSICRASA